MEYDNTNRGTLGKNLNKKSDSHPDYSGQLNIDGTDYWLSGWLKESKKDGSKFFSLAVKPKDSIAAYAMTSFVLSPVIVSMRTPRKDED